VHKTVLDSEEFRRLVAGRWRVSLVLTLLLFVLYYGYIILIATNRQFVRNWKMEDLLPELQKSVSPNLGRGRQALADAQCLTCHRFGNDGESVLGQEWNAAHA